jgi:hypothetical protein
MYAAEIDSQSGSSPLDWHLDPSVAMSCHSLPREIEERLGALLAHFGLVYGAIDLRLTLDEIPAVSNCDHGKAQSNLTINIIGVSSFDGAAICGALA